VPPGLRERKKQRTREEIVRVALELFAAQGYAATTIAQIADAAEVSPRTVSSYFPSKEDLVFPREGETLARLEARLAERSGGESAIDALRGWILDEQDTWRARDGEMRCQHAIIDASEELQSRKRAQLARFEELLCAAIAEDLGLGPEALEPRMAAAATVAVIDRVGEEHRHAVDAGTTQELLEEDAIRLLDRALAFVTAGVGALRAD
jgi:AcrR family transcriptional regulator